MSQPPRRLVPRPPDPDEPVWLMNTCYERQADGSWLGWIEPVASEPASSQERALEVRGPTAHDAKLLMGERLTMFLDALGSEAAEEDFKRRYGRTMLYRDVPPVAWPPQGDSWRLLDFPPPAE